MALRTIKKPGLPAAHDIVAELKATGQYENTVICYLQDNGGNSETNGRVGPFTPRAAAPISFA